MIIIILTSIIYNVNILVWQLWLYIKINTRPMSRVYEKYCTIYYMISGTTLSLSLWERAAPSPDGMTMVLTARASLSQPVAEATSEHSLLFYGQNLVNTHCFYAIWLLIYDIPHYYWPNFNRQARRIYPLWATWLGQIMPLGLELCETK